jgi:hypothetical protein
MFRHILSNCLEICLKLLKETWRNLSVKIADMSNLVEILTGNRVNTRVEHCFCASLRRRWSVTRLKLVLKLPLHAYAYGYTMFS